MTYGITDTPHLDAEFRVFTAAAINSTGLTGLNGLIATGITTTLASWTAPGTGKPAMFTEVTARTNWAGGFKTELRGNSITWQAELSGEDYDATLLGLGCPVVMWRRYWVLGVGWQSWAIEYVGQFVAGDGADDYRVGGRWQRNIAGVAYNLGRKNAPRMTVGRPNVLDGATVSIKNSDTLADVSLETDQTEFYGGLPSVQPGNMVDGKLNTVWISSSAPTVTVESLPVMAVDGGTIITEVFCMPVAGYSANTCWWVEVFNYRNRDANGIDRITFGSNPVSNGPGYDYTQTTLVIPSSYVLHPGRFAIICANRSVFEKLTGGAPNAEFVYDVSEQGASLTISATDGFVSTAGVASTMIWAPSGATRRIDHQPALTRGSWSNGSPNYGKQATFNSSNLVAGSSIKRNVMACRVETDGMAGQASDFSLELYPSPGSHSSSRGGVAILVTLHPPALHLENTIANGATSVELDGITGIFSSGQIYISGGNVFSYTGRNGNILTGCSGVSGSHSAGTQVWPYAAVQMSSGVVSAQQTGYPVATLGWQRRKTPVPTDWLLYTSYLASTRQFQESGFLTDYYPSVISPAGQSAAQLSWSTQLTNNAQPYAWVANFLLVINQMGDLGRAKINELLGTLAQINVSPGAFVIDLPSSVGVAKYLLNTYFGLLTTDTNFTNILPMEHQIGSYAIAVRPLTEVLDDLARMTGCLIYYNPSGIVEWFDDPRWPLTLTAITNTLAAGGMRGELQWSESQPDIDYIILNATIVSQDAPIPIRIVYPPPAYPATEPATGLQGVEISGYFVTAQWEARNVAEGLFRERLIDGTATVTCTAATTWHAGDTVRVLWDFDGDGTAEERKYIVEQVEEARSGTGQARQLAYKLSLRRIRDY